jgi:hypothetical protein
MSMEPKVKLRTLAGISAPLQVIFGSPLFRWFDKQLPPGYIQLGTCARVMRVSTVPWDYAFSGPRTPEQLRIQIDVLDFDPVTCAAAAKAVDDFMMTVDLVNHNQFDSPPTSAQQAQNFKMNQRDGMESQLGKPAHVEILEYRVFNDQTW